MRTVLPVLSFIVCSVIFSGANSQNVRGPTGCPNACVTVSQLFGDDIHTRIELKCDETRRMCLGEGRFRIFGEEVSVNILAEFVPGGLVFRIKNEQDSLGAEGQDFFHMPLGRTLKQTKDFALYRLPDQGTFRSDRATIAPTPLVYRFGDRMPGTIRVVVEKGRR